ncbi:MAG: erythromycin esterase family protein, partial [Bacteroidota bacterium]
MGLLRLIPYSTTAMSDLRIVAPYGFFFILLGLWACNPDPVVQPTTSPQPAVLTDAQQAIVDGLDSAQHEIAAKPFDVTDEELQVLDYLADTKVVGLGEATHGTREFFQMKHRVFQYLVEKHGYDAFVFEMDFAEAMIFDRWIQGESQADLRNLMRTEMLFWTWATEEVLELFTWMRDYNIAHPDKRVHLYGVDTQAPFYNLKELTRQLDAILPALADSMRFYHGAEYEKMFDLYDAKDQEAAERIQKNLQHTHLLIEQARDELVSLSSEENYALIAQLHLHMEQVEAHNYQFTHQGQPPLRDKYMADNTRWWLDQSPEGTQHVLWAHNYHVSNIYTGNLWNDSQGGYLKNFYQSDYQIIGFGKNTGRFTAFNGGVLRENIITTIGNSGSSNYIFS